MAHTMREPSLATIGLGGVLDIFRAGGLPASAGETVDKVFGGAGDRGSLVISGANGMVGAGKTMQLASRLQRYGVRIAALDFPGSPDGIGRHYPGLARTFGAEQANEIMGSVVRFHYDGKRVPAELRELKPAFLLEAIPEILAVKKAHYEVFRGAFPGIEIRSVTSGFPSSALGVGIAHPAFPHEINKVWEIVEPESSPITHLLWTIGLIPIPVGDYWSFVLDVVFCGLTHAAVAYHESRNMPYWKIDKYVRSLLGPNPFRAHDAIGAKGANFLTWSCLHHLGERYGDLFRPTPEMIEHKDAGADWYPPNHFRPMVDWHLAPEEVEDLKDRILGPLLQMTSLLVHEERAALPHVNAIGELCAQFRRGVLAMAREMGPEEARRRVAAYHEIHPEAAAKAWHPEAFDSIGRPDWQQLYVNAEHDGTIGVITFGRESYNTDVDAELNRAVDWLKAQGIDRVIVTGDFHLSTQLVGADTTDFFPALERVEEGLRISDSWSRTARRLHDEFRVSIGFVNGKRCLGGFLELLMHCRYLIAVDGAELGMPEVTLPVVPGMEGCHWPFRKAPAEAWPKIVTMLLGGKSVPAREAVGWLADYVGPLEDALRVAWRTAGSGDSGLRERAIDRGALRGIPLDTAALTAAGRPAVEGARRAIAESITDSCSIPIEEALAVQARHSARFMASSLCREGRIGAEYQRSASI
jgi:enoyl-CoA hydratase/carnithine racemase